MLLDHWINMIIPVKLNTLVVNLSIKPSELSMAEYYSKCEIGPDEMKDFLNRVMDTLQMMSISGHLLNYQPHKGKIISVIKEDNIS